jgi:hypothetical protein
MEIRFKKFKKGEETGFKINKKLYILRGLNNTWTLVFTVLKKFIFEKVSLLNYKIKNNISAI